MAVPNPRTGCPVLTGMRLDHTIQSCAQTDHTPSIEKPKVGAAIRHRQVQMDEAKARRKKAQ